jgi:2-oxoisovalerate dehydrogenase E1 component
MSNQLQQIQEVQEIPSELLHLIKQAVLIRKTEEKLLELFSLGKLNGTVHTCVGQELSAVAVLNNLLQDDFVVSNHRGHGHYIARTGDIKGMIAEILGKKSGSVGGVGGSQHLANHKYLSNGIQGGMTPVISGIALANKLRNTNNISIAFTGDGTFGEGILYESLNIAAVWDLPVLFVLENNGYAQSTSMKQTFKGSVQQRVEGFGLTYFQTSTENPASLLEVCAQAKEYVRSNSKPCLLEIQTQRLNSHSKSDDNRRVDEVMQAHQKDYLNIFAEKYADIYRQIEAAVVTQINECLAEAEATETLTHYQNTPLPVLKKKVTYKKITAQSDKRFNVLLYETFKKHFSNDAFIMIGEDIQNLSPFTEKPYGGAFKVTGNLSDLFPGRIRNTPISEAAIIGIGTGLAVEGFRPIIEIMFGDFLTLGLDQLLQHASKFKKMFNGRVNVPLVVRTPMGGKRGYGPTHSQSIEKFFLGIPDLTVVALNHRLHPEVIYDAIFETCNDPVLVIENKILYTRKLNETAIDGFVIEQSADVFPAIKISPQDVDATITVVCYGGMLEDVEKAVQLAFDEADILCEIICPTCLHPLDISPIAESINKTGRLLMVEEGPGFAALGAEIIASLAEHAVPLKKTIRMSNNTIIPCSFTAENNLLPNPQTILQKIKELKNG